MATEYDFNQQIDSINLLTTLITQAALSSTLQSVTCTGVGPSMIVAVVFTTALSSGDQTTLNGIMSSYSSTEGAKNTHMISSISTAIQTQSNLITLLTIKVGQVIPGLSYDQLVNIMTVLGLT